MDEQQQAAAAAPIDETCQAALYAGLAVGLLARLEPGDPRRVADLRRQIAAHLPASAHAAATLASLERLRAAFAGLACAGVGAGKSARQLLIEIEALRLEDFV